MNLTFSIPAVELLLHPHQVLNLDNHRHRMAIECKNGTIWVTCSGEIKDYVLDAGKRYVLGKKGTVVIEAIDESCVEIEENG